MREPSPQIINESGDNQTCSITNHTSHHYSIIFLQFRQPRQQRQLALREPVCNHEA